MAKLQQVFSLALDEKKNLYAPIDFIKNTFYAMFSLSFLNTVRVNVVLKITKNPNFPTSLSGP